MYINNSSVEEQKNYSIPSKPLNKRYFESLVAGAFILKRIVRQYWKKST